MGNNAIAKAALDGWQLSGVTKMTGGTRGGFTYSFTGAPPQETLTGGFGGSRVVLVCDPNLPRSQRTFDRQFRTECIQPPGPLTNPSDTLYQAAPSATSGSASGSSTTTWCCSRTSRSVGDGR
jgi:hypothetical protein